MFEFLVALLAVCLLIEFAPFLIMAVLTIFCLIMALATWVKEKLTK